MTGKKQSSKRTDNMSIVIKVLVWFICFLVAMGAGFTLLNAASTVANIVGVVVLVLTVAISVKTVFFTSIKSNKNNNEK